MTKPNCYKCKHRGSLPGSAHSKCRHPEVKPVSDDPLVEVLGILASVGRAAPIDCAGVLGVRGNEVGIRRGWFNWPVNFDPAWLLSCDGFDPKEEEGHG